MQQQDAPPFEFTSPELNAYRISGIDRLPNTSYAGKRIALDALAYGLGWDLDTDIEPRVGSSRIRIYQRTERAINDPSVPDPSPDEAIQIARMKLGDAGAQLLGKTQPTGFLDPHVVTATVAERRGGNPSAAGSDQQPPRPAARVSQAQVRLLRHLYLAVR